MPGWMKQNLNQDSQKKYHKLRIWKGFPDCSVGKESTCNAGDSISIPGWGRCTGERIGYPFKYSRASLVALLIKNLLAIKETWV